MSGCISCNNFLKHLIVELVRYMAIMLPLFLSVWRATVLTTLALDPITIYMILSFVTVVGYIPIKLVLNHGCFEWARDNTGWRMTVLIYIILCGSPSMSLLAWAIVTNNTDTASYNVDAKSMMVIQFAIVGLVVTEWAAKVRENTINTGVLAAAAADLFYAYDVYDFFEKQLHEDTDSAMLVYVVFGFGILSMFKYVPSMPADCDKAEDCPDVAARGILAGTLCQDLPFLVARVTAIFHRGFTTEDFLYPLKNLVQIIINGWQLKILGKLKVGDGGLLSLSNCCG